MRGRKVWETYSRLKRETAEFKRQNTKARVRDQAEMESRAKTYHHSQSAHALSDFLVAKVLEEEDGESDLARRRALKA